MPAYHRPRALLLSAAAVGLAAGPLAGCATLDPAERGAVIGAATGGAVGAAVGRATGSTARGAIIGASVGGAAGAIIGHRMDRQAEEIDQNVAGATVERVGEGIEVTFESGLLFDFDSYAVRPQARENLRNLAGSLDRYPGTELLVVGHTDSVGTADYNQRLSEQRARAAADYLVTQGVARDRIRAVGMGQGEPKASNATEEGRAENRRVEVAIFAGDSLRTQATRQVGTGR